MRPIFQDIGKNLTRISIIEVDRKGRDDARAVGQIERADDGTDWIWQPDSTANRSLRHSGYDHRCGRGLDRNQPRHVAQPSGRPRETRPATLNRVSVYSVASRERARAFSFAERNEERPMQKYYTVLQQTDSGLTYRHYLNAQDVDSAITEVRCGDGLPDTPTQTANIYHAHGNETVAERVPVRKQTATLKC